MPALRVTFRLVLSFFGGFISTVVLYLLGALVLGFFSTEEVPIVQAEMDTDIFVRSNGVHTDFVLPVQSGATNWAQLFPYQDFGKVDSTYRFIAFGWGDKGFYIDTPEWSDLKFSTAFNALFFLSSTAMHVTYLSNQPTEGETCRRIPLTQAQHQQLLAYIQQSFQLDQAGNMQLLKGKSYGQRDNFYEARGQYSFLRTCNVWTGQGLQRIGVRTPVWSPFDRAILYHLPLLNQKAAE